VTWRSALPTVDASEPLPVDATLRSIGEAAAASVGAAGYGTVTFGNLAGNAVVTAVELAGATPNLPYAKKIRIGHAWMAGGAAPEDAPATERNTAVSFRYRRTRPWTDLRRQIRDTYQAADVCDEARVLLFDGRRALGLVAVHRASVDGLFAVADLERIDSRVHEWRRRLLGSLARGEGFSGATASLLFRADGRLEHASLGARRWLDGARRARLEELAALVARGVEPSGDFCVGEGTVARFSRLRGEGRAVVLATLSPTDPALVSPEADLSPRQREVIRFALAGASAPEISEALGLSAHTVRDHLGAAYQVLGVRSRAALARLAAEQGWA